MTIIEQLLSVATNYGAAEMVEPSTVSWRVFGDSKKLGAIIAGADLQTRRFEQAMSWFGANWPEAAEWPSEVPRPAEASPAEAA